MAFMFQRSLAIPLWAIALFAVAVTVPLPGTAPLMPAATLFVAAVGTAVIVLTLRRALTRLRASGSRVPIRSSSRRAQASAGIAISAGTGVRTLAERNRERAHDALDLVRMDDDGGWQMAPRQRHSPRGTPC